MKKYKIARKLGAGGMGDVFIARDLENERDVAIKILQPQFSASQESQDRFLREMQVSSALDHPNIIRVYDYGESDGTLYYVMQLVDGRSIQEIVKEGAMDVHDAVDVAAGIASALDYIHPRELIHRDLKPANVMVTPTGEAILLDFGLVKALAEISLTMTGKVIGTPRYMAPEMMITGKVDLRSDIYQLGSILYEMVTGNHAIPGKTRKEVAQRCLYEVPIPPSQHNSEVDPDLENLVMNALEKDPEERYATAAAFLEDVEAYRAGKPVPRRGSGRPARERPRKKEEAASTAARQPSTKVAPRRSSGAVPRSPPDAAPGGGPPATPGVAPPRVGSMAAVANTASIRAPSDLQPRRADARVLGLAATGVVALLLLLGYGVKSILFPPVVYEARDIDVRPVYGGAEISWRSDRSYDDHLLVRVDGREPQPRRFPTSGITHDVELLGFDPGRRVRFRIAFPDGKTSPEYEFVALGLPEVKPEFELVSAFMGTATVETGEIPVQLEVQLEGTEEETWKSSGRATRHSVPVPLPADAGSVWLRASAFPHPGTEVPLFSRQEFPGIEARLEEIRASRNVPEEKISRLLGPLRQLFRDTERVAARTKVKLYERLELVRDRAEDRRAQGQRVGPDPEAGLHESFRPGKTAPSGGTSISAGRFLGKNMADQYTADGSLRFARVHGRFKGIPAQAAAARTAAVVVRMSGRRSPGGVLRIELEGLVRLSAYFGAGGGMDFRDPVVHRFDPRILADRAEVPVELRFESLTGQGLEGNILALQGIELVLDW